MRTRSRPRTDSFSRQAERVLSLPVLFPVGRLGGYGPNREVIYHAHPTGCPSVLVDSRQNATATLMSNGSVAFEVRLAEGMDVAVLEGSFDPSVKRECRVPSQNVWLDVAVGGRGHIASLINPKVNVCCESTAVRIVKLGDPDRAMWYCASFAPARGFAYDTAAKLSLAYTARGPALLRQVYVRNSGRRVIRGTLWTYFNLHGTQRFVYNKDLWYDSGLPISDREIVVSATVPYSAILQIKRLSSLARDMKLVDATCDYATFIGDTSVPSVLPGAVRAGCMLPAGAGRNLNRFSTPSLAACQFAVHLRPGQAATLRQSLLYVTDPTVIEEFRRLAACPTASYKDMSRAFVAAAKRLIRQTPSAKECLAAAGGSRAAARAPYFEISLPAQPAVSAYANSVWTGVKELYENCRAHGARLANGIELGTRDRAQDMWPKLKEDPARVRADLVHALSFMYVTCDRPPRNVGSLTLRQKLHGMFPRQYPSRWDDRTQEIFNDNRPYNDSALWLLNSVNRYIRETGDHRILREKVKTVRLTSPDRPETSGLVGCDVAHTIAETMVEALECLHRHALDSPYGMAQILYGDWCDPVDMYGTGTIGDAKTRGMGKGVQARLSAHLFLTLVETIDLFEAPRAAKSVRRLNLGPRVARLKRFADTLRRDIVKAAWEDGPAGFPAGFINAIHEWKADGSRPHYGKGELGYTLGSMKGTDFDGVNRRELAVQAFCLAMLTTERDYLAGVPRSAEMVRAILRTVDGLFFDPKLGLVMFTPPIANDKLARDLVGRMGVVPSGCAENGEYHHCQAFMHRFRLDLAGEADTVWRQFKPMMSVMRDESLGGPFETPCTSYASDQDDPHFGKGMYFGLSGSVDWIVEIFHRIAGVELALHDERRAAVVVDPVLPAELRDRLTFKRVIHYALPAGGYREIPLTVQVSRKGSGKTLKETAVTINGRRAAKAEVRDLSRFRRLNFRIVRIYGK